MRGFVASWVLVVAVGCSSHDGSVHPISAKAYNSTACRESEETWDSLQLRLRQLKQSFAVEVNISKTEITESEISLEDVTESDIATTVPFFVASVKSALGKMSPRFLELAKLKMISLGKNLTMRGQNQSGIAYYRSGQLLFDVGSFGCNTEYVESLISHELFHLIHLTGPVGFAGDEKKWLSLNYDGFKYLEKTDPTRQLRLIFDHSWLGFVSEYSARNYKEDAAETFSAMTVTAAAKKVADWILSDRYLKAKVDFLKTELTNKVSDHYDETYWAGIADGTLTQWQWR